MKLYLSSYYFGDHPTDFSNLIGDNKKVAIIMNATDISPSDKHSIYLDREVAKMAELDLDAEELDLRQYFDNNDNLGAKLNEYGAVWVMGGNTFVLRRAMKQSSFDKLIVEKIKDDSIIYGGFSAGSCVTSRTLHGIELIDNPNEIAEGYDTDVIWDGLGLIDYSIVPHFNSEHKESVVMNDVVKYFIDNNLPYKTLRDGEAIVIK